MGSFIVIVFYPAVQIFLKFFHRSIEFCPRTQLTLDKLNSILKQYVQSGNKEFSVTTIGSVSSSNGGPGYQSFRATKNSHYRCLIEASAASAGTDMKKPITDFSRSRDIPNDNKLLERLDDPALRALFGQIIAERGRLKREVNLLKQHSSIVIDRRPVERTEYRSAAVLPSQLGNLSSLEVEALRVAISDECMEKHGWLSTKAG